MAALRLLASAATGYFLDQVTVFIFAFAEGEPVRDKPQSPYALIGPFSFVTETLIVSSLGSIKGSASPICPTKICNRGYRSKVPPRMRRITWIAVSMCQPQPGPASSSVTICENPEYDAWMTDWGGWVGWR